MMNDEFKNRLDAIDQATLTPLVRRLLENDKADVVSWHYRPVEGGLGASYGVYRFQGEVQTEREILDWSLILKAMGPSTGSQDPTAGNYWKREVLVYQSGLLDDLPGDLTAPRCVGVVESPGEESWLWLEDIIERGDTVWPLERFGLAARHLGQFNGAYLAGKPIPAVPWLATSQFRQRLAMAERGIAELPHLSHNPLFKDLLPDEGAERSLALWAERWRLLALLERLPRSLCHRDAFRRNLIAQDDRDGRAQTVAVDWAEMGVGWIGEEIVSLFATSLGFVEIDLNKIAILDALIFAGYVAGLRDAGWFGEVRLVRFGFAALAALGSIADRAIKWPRIARRVAALPAGTEPPRLLDAGGPAQYAARQRHLLDLGDEAQALLME